MSDTGLSYEDAKQSLKRKRERERAPAPASILIELKEMVHDSLSEREFGQ